MRPQRERVVLAAYADTGALQRPCPTCGSEVNEWCHVDGHTRRIPCVARTAGAIYIGEDEPAARDFTEPVHQQHD